MIDHGHIVGTPFNAPEVEWFVKEVVEEATAAKAEVAGRWCPYVEVELFTYLKCL